MKLRAWLRTIVGGAMIALLASCGGGGGAGGSGPYTISLRADSTQLPLNIASEEPYIGSNYTTALHVSATDNAGRPIPGGEGVFACAQISGSGTGALYYMDTDTDHTTTTTQTDGTSRTTQKAFGSVSLVANSGASTVFYHAWGVAGTATIRCTVTEPSTNIQRSAQVTIQVGGASSGKASQVLIDKVDPAYSGYIYVQGVNTYNQLPLQATIVDEAGQAIPNPSTGNNNIQVRIVPSTTTTADDDALLRGSNASSLGVSGQSIHVQTVNGLAPFTLVSGTSPGTVTLEVVTDRADNNVGNGITQPIYNYASVSVVVSAPGSTTATPIQITTTTLPSATGNITYGALLEATGGTAPYVWSLVSTALPTGLSLSSSGVIYGLPYGTSSGNYSFVVQATDARGSTKQQALSINYTAPTATPVPIPSLVVTPSSGTGAVGGTLSFVVTGGTPSYVAVSNNDAVAVVSGGGAVQNTGGVYRFSASLIAAGTTQIAVTDQSGQAVVVNVTVTGGSTGVTDLTITPSVGGSIAIGQQQQFMVSGGVAPYTILSTNTTIGTVSSPVNSTGGVFTFTPLAEGPVTIIVRDATGAVKTTSVTVTQPGGTQLAVLPTSATWSGSCSTTLAFTDFVVYGGVPPYTAFSTALSVAIVTGPFTNASNYVYFRVNEACVATGNATIVIRDSVNATQSVTFTYTP